MFVYTNYLLYMDTVFTRTIAWGLYTFRPFLLKCFSRLQIIKYINDPINLMFRKETNIADTVNLEDPIYPIILN